MELLRNYELLEPLGQGNYGTVTLAERDGQFYAVKSMKSKKAAKSFTYEAEIGARIGYHPNIPQLVEVLRDETGQVQHLVFQYVDAVSLMDFATDSAHFAWTIKDTLEITRQLALTLDYVHSLGISHGDIKPENILVNRSDEGAWKVYLIDFGLGSSQSNAFQNVSRYVGSELYIAPEIDEAFHKGQSYNGQKSDIWSLGVCIYILLFAELPEIDAELPTSCTCELPSVFRHLLRSMLSISPASRPHARAIANACKLDSRPRSASTTGLRHCVAPEMHHFRQMVACQEV